MERFEEIERRLRDGRSLGEIARALGCSRKTVRAVRDGLRRSPAIPLAVADPLWMSQVERSAVVHELGLGHPLKFIWEERAQRLTGYPNFWKQFYRKFPELKQATVTAPDCLKQGVLKCHRYDPDLNPSYAALAAHYRTAVVPARPAHPRDKAVVEGLVNILMRYLRFRYRRHRFTSIAAINQALGECVRRINERRHTRFGIARRERLALHPRDRSRSGKRIKIDSHFPAASIAYYEATPQHLLSQSRFVHAEFHQLVVELFNTDVYGKPRPTT